MSGVHIVGDVGRFEPLLRTWARNGLQAVLSVKPEGSNGALLRSILPNGTLVGRITNNSTLRDTDIQQRYEADPKATAAWIVGLYLPTMNAQPQFNAWQFNNEPVFGDGETRLFRIRRLCEFTRELIDLANSHGRGVALFNFARGTPEPHEWIHFHEVWRYALSKNRTLPPGRKNILCLHQYGSFNKAGAGSLFWEQAWHIKRFETQVRPSLPADLKAAEYLINESGPDGGQQNLKGWKEVYGQNDAGRGALVTDWRIYNEWLATQAGCLGSCFFTLGQEGSFDSFNIENDPVAQMLANTHYPTMKPATTQPAPPPVPVPPTGGNMTLTDRFIQLAQTKWGNKFEDLRATLPKHATLKFNPIDSRLMQYICFHHTATAVNATWKRIAEAHIAADPARNKEEWAGIGYHLGFRQGKVALLADLDTQRAHVKGRNHEALGLVWMGNSDTVPVPDGDKALMREAVELLDELYARDKELTWHGKMLINYTECPGSSMKQIVPTLRAPVAPPVPPPLAYTDEERAKAKWFTEQLARTLRGDPDATATLISALISEPKKAGLHNVLVAKALPSLERVP